MNSLRAVKIRHERGRMDAFLGLRRWLVVLAVVAAVGPGKASTALAQFPPKPPIRPEAAMGLADLIEKTAQSVVLITVESSRGDKLGIGSGFLIDASGLVATNYHVIRMADKAGVQFRDGSKAAIKGVRASDEKADLAILELDKTPPKARPLTLGPASPPRPGEPVTAIGHPRGLDFSATKGIVSAIRNSKDMVAGNVPVKPEENRVWIQTDAVIAGGSSGGPLLSDTGQVLGVNTVMIPGQGISFAVHVSHLSALLETARKATIKKLPGDLAAGQDNPLSPMRPRIKELYEEYENAYGEYQKELQNAASTVQYQIVLRNQNPGPKYAARFIKIAGEEKLTTTAFQALYLACVLDAPDGQAKYLKQSVARLRREHLKDKGLLYAIPPLSEQDHDDVRGFLRAALEQSPHRDVQGVACLYLASALLSKEKSEEAEVLRLLKRCTGEFGTIKIGENVVAEYARPMMRGVEHLRVGKPALDIMGTDVDGKSIKLSDYRGKVVIVDFFADWCPYCVRMYPEERDLVKAMAGKPFAILGVNADGRDTLKHIVEEKKIVWPCWADGKGGPIAEEWLVGSYPTMFMLDHEGIIRQKFVGMTQPGLLTKTVEKLVSAVPGPKNLAQRKDEGKKAVQVPGVKKTPALSEPKTKSGPK